MSNRMTFSITQETYSARCLCGRIELHAQGDGKNVTLCHCNWCKRSSGAAFVPWVTFAKEDFVVTKGALKLFSSGAISERGFCPDCGATLTFHFPKTVDIALGAFDDPEAFRAKKHIWTSQQLPQIEFIDELPRSEHE